MRSAVAPASANRQIAPMAQTTQTTTMTTTPFPVACPPATCRMADGSPYTWLGALAGVAYVAAVAVLRWRG
jgi:hypothetical protein